MKIIKLNFRWKAFPFFQYAVNPSNQNINIRNHENVYKFETVRQWCVTTWGDSPIFDIWWLSDQLEGDFRGLRNEHWSYDVSNRNGVPIMRVYLHGEKELALYQLKWS